MTPHGSAPRPPAQVAIDIDTIVALLHDQHPDLADLPLRPVGDGWDNFVYRLGPRLAVRMPRRERSLANLANEVRWLPELARELTLPVPVAVRRGVAGAKYPWPWAICEWVPGRPATQAPFADPVAAATALAEFLRELHRPTPPQAPRNPLRGIALADRVQALAAAKQRLPGVWTPALARIWEQALAAPAHAGPDLWLHGDLHPANLVTRAGRLAGVIDFGDLCAGDPATDLAVAWLAFPQRAHAPLRQHADELGPGTWERARGWAVALALAIAANSADDPALARVAAAALRRLHAEQS